MTHIRGGTSIVAARPRPGMIRVRWLIFALLFLFSFVSYFQRAAISVAGERMMPELGIGTSAFSWIVAAFMVGYTAFQIPGGVLGEVIGARRALVWLGVLSVLTTLVFVGLPLMLGGAVLLVALIAARFVFGIAQAPIFPVGSGVIETWFPARQWNVTQGVISTGINFGSAFATPLVAMAMVAFGWKVAVLLTTLPVALVTLVWSFYARDLPQRHPAVSQAELDELDVVTPAAAAQTITLGHVVRLLARRDVLVLSLSYLIMNYVYYFLGTWCFLYLVEERHLSVLQSGWLASLPFVAAAVGAWLGGGMADRACARMGARWGFRIVPLVALPLTGIALWLAVSVQSVVPALAGLCLAFFALETCEGPYWAGMTYLARKDTMIATALLNTGGSLGGVIGIPIAGWLAEQGQWPAAFAIGSGCAVMSALLWLVTDVCRTAGEEQP